MSNLNYLIAAYSVVWLIVAFYLFILIHRNKRLSRQIDALEQRVRDLTDRRERADGA